MIYLDKIDESFKPFFEMKEVQEELVKINNFLKEEISKGYEITPKKENILRFATVPVSKYEVVVIGQDPYPAKNRATGRAFEVNNLNSFTDKFSQQSIKNIITAINMDITDKDYRKYDEIKIDIDKGLFHIQYPKSYFSALEEQGIIFLNTAFTCRVGKPDLHTKVWKIFTKLLLEYISNNANPTWILWGSKAQDLALYMKGNKITNYHPSYKDRIANEYPFFKKPFDSLSKDWTGIIHKAKLNKDNTFNKEINSNIINIESIFIENKINNLLLNLENEDKFLIKIEVNNNIIKIGTIKIINNRPVLIKLV